MLKTRNLKRLENQNSFSLYLPGDRRLKMADQPILPGWSTYLARLINLCADVLFIRSSVLFPFLKSHPVIVKWSSKYLKTLETDAKDAFYRMQKENLLKSHPANIRLRCTWDPGVSSVNLALKTRPVQHLWILIEQVGSLKLRGCSIFATKISKTSLNLPWHLPSSKLTWQAGKSTIFNRRYIFNPVPISSQLS